MITFPVNNADVDRGVDRARKSWTHPAINGAARAKARSSNRICSGRPGTSLRRGAGEERWPCTQFKHMGNTRVQWHGLQLEGHPNGVAVWGPWEPPSSADRARGAAV